MRAASMKTATNNHSNTVPDVTAVTVMLNKLPIATEKTDRAELKARAAGLRAGFFTGRLFAAICTPKERGQAALQPDPRRSPCRVDPDRVRQHRTASQDKP